MSNLFWAKCNHKQKILTPSECQIMLKEILRKQKKTRKMCIVIMLPLYWPAIVIESNKIEPVLKDDRQSISLPAAIAFLNISFKLPAMVIS